MVKTLPKRSEVRQEVTWDLQSVYPTDAAWEAALQEASAEIPGLEHFRGTLGESGGRLLDALETRQALLLRVDNVPLQAGQVAQDGPPDHLVRHNGLYRSLVQREMSRLAPQAA